MDDAVRGFGVELGRRVVTRDWPAVHQMLAPWLREETTAQGVQAFFEVEYRRTLEANGIEGLRYPEHPEPEVGGNAFTNATQLREPISFMGGKVRSVPPAVTDENMRYWLKLQLQCSDNEMEELGFDSFAEIWMAVVETPEGLRVGYWSHGAY